MGENTKIEWATHTFNPWRGCTKVSAGCDNCYADTGSKRNPAVLGIWGKYGTRVVASDAMWREPLKWNAAAEQAGERHRVFCASLADVFEGEDSMPADAWLAVQQARGRLFKLIETTRNLDWLLLTKRPHLAMKIVPERWTTRCTPKGERAERFPKNLWIGTSVEDQKTADERIPQLLQIPAAVRFLSMEPLLGPVDLTNLAIIRHEDGFGDVSLNCLNGHVKGPDDMTDLQINWVIVGGESGGKARPMHPDWVRSLRDQCQAASVPFFFKQWGEWTVASDENLAMCQVRWNADSDNTCWLDSDGTVRSGSSNGMSPRAFGMIRVGKNKSGRLLDGREWNEVPEEKQHDKK